MALSCTGGEPTVDNIELRCRAHNGYEAELYFGLHKPPMAREMRTPYRHSVVGLPRLWGGGSASELGPDRVGAPSSALSSSMDSLFLSRAVRRSLIKVHQ